MSLLIVSFHTTMIFVLYRPTHHAGHVLPNGGEIPGYVKVHTGKCLTSVYTIN